MTSKIENCLQFVHISIVLIKVLTGTA